MGKEECVGCAVWKADSKPRPQGECPMGMKPTHGRRAADSRVRWVRGMKEAVVEQLAIEILGGIYPRSADWPAHHTPQGYETEPRSDGPVDGQGATNYSRQDQAQKAQ